MMHIDDGIQSCRLCISYDFRDPVKPGVLYLIFRSLSDMSQPCHRDADSIESRRLDLCESCLGCLRIAPKSLSRHTVVLSIEVISHIPAYTQAFGHLPRKVAVILRNVTVTSLISAAAAAIAFSGLLRYVYIYLLLSCDNR